MFRRRSSAGVGGASGPPSAAEVYQGLRARALTLVPGDVGLSVTGSRLRVFGVIMDIGHPSSSATLVALVDGTGSLYTSNDGGAIGGEEHAQVASTARRSVLTAQARLSVFQRSSGLDLPPAGEVRITVLTLHGSRTVVAPEDELAQGQHLASAVFFAAQEVIAAIRIAAQGPVAADVANTLPGGVTRLMVAAHLGHSGRTWECMDQGDVIDAQDDLGYTAVMYAANEGHVEALRTLLEHGANPNIADVEGSTPLMVAAQSGHIEIVELLLRADADPRPMGTHGLTALAFARLCGHSETVAILSTAEEH